MATKTKLDLIYMIFMHSKLEFYRQAINCARTIIRRKLFERPFDIIQVMSISTDREVNCQPSTPMAVTLEVLKTLDEFEEEINDDCKEVKLSYAIKVALHQLNEFQNLSDRKEKPVSIQIVIFTELASGEISEQTVGNLLDNWKTEARIYILGPNVNLPLNINSTLDEIESVMEHEELLPKYPQLHRFLKMSRGLVCNLDLGQCLLDVYKPQVKLPMPWKVDLRIGKNFRIRVIGFRHTDKIKGIKFQTQKFDNATKMETTVDKKILGFAGKSEVKLDETKDLHIASGGEKVYLTKNDKNVYKPQTVRCLDMVFVVDKLEINELYNIGDSTYFLYPDADSPESTLSFLSLYDAVREHNCVVITRKCYNKNNYPKLHALIPHDTKKCFKMFQVPFKNYIMDTFQFYPQTTGLWKNPKPSSDGNNDVRDAVYNFLSALDLTEGDIPNYVPAQMTPNPKLDAIYQTVLEHLKKTDDKPLDEYGSDIITVPEIPLLKQPITIANRAADALSKLEDLLN